MPKVSGVFDSFENLDQISPEDIARWLKSPPQIRELANFIANRIYYPQTLPLTLPDLDIDLAILREALRRNPVFFKLQQRKIFIPESFLNLVSDLKKLALIFTDAYEPRELVTFILSTPKGDEILGSLARVEGSTSDLSFNIDGKNFNVKPGSLTILPCPKSRCHISFKSSNAKVMGKKEILFETMGGKLGLIVDGRWK